MHHIAPRLQDARLFVQRIIDIASQGATLLLPYRTYNVVPSSWQVVLEPTWGSRDACSVLTYLLNVASSLIC